MRCRTIAAAIWACGGIIMLSGCAGLSARPTAHRPHPASRRALVIDAPLSVALSSAAAVLSERGFRVTANARANGRRLLRARRLRVRPSDIGDRTVDRVTLRFRAIAAKRTRLLLVGRRQRTVRRAADGTFEGFLLSPVVSNRFRWRRRTWWEPLSLHGLARRIAAAAGHRNRDMFADL